MFVQSFRWIRTLCVSTFNPRENDLTPFASLCRNARRYLALPEEAAFLRATANTRIYNGLECKITCQNSKVSHDSLRFEFWKSFYHVSLQFVSVMASESPSSSLWPRYPT